MPAGRCIGAITGKRRLFCNLERRDVEFIVGVAAARDEKEACRAIPGAPPPSLLPFVHLISLVEGRLRACSFENAEVELESDERELRDRIARQSGRLAGGAARTAQIRPDQQRGRGRRELVQLLAKRQPDRQVAATTGVVRSAQAGSDLDRDAGDVRAAPESPCRRCAGVSGRSLRPRSWRFAGRPPPFSRPTPRCRCRGETRSVATRCATRGRTL